MILKGKRSELFSEIGSSHNAEEAVLKVKPSSLLIAHLLSNTKVKRLVCSPGIHKTFTKKVLRALEKMNIRVTVRKARRGRPTSVPDSSIDAARKLITKGSPVRDAAKKLNISERTLFYRLSKRRS